MDEATLWMQAESGNRYRVWEVREYRTYPPGHYPQTRWARFLLGGNPRDIEGRPIRGVKNWVLEPLDRLVIEP